MPPRRGQPSLVSGPGGLVHDQAYRLDDAGRAAGEAAVEHAEVMAEEQVILLPGRRDLPPGPELGPVQAGGHEHLVAEQSSRFPFALAARAVLGQRDRQRVAQPLGRRELGFAVMEGQAVPGRLVKAELSPVPSRIPKSRSSKLETMPIGSPAFSTASSRLGTPGTSSYAAGSVIADAAARATDSSVPGSAGTRAAPRIRVTCPVQ
jgi:hypothetical protein